jgi:phosphoadenosine phosphosulfate reductase
LAANFIHLWQGNPVWAGLPCSRVVVFHITTFIRSNVLLVLLMLSKSELEKRNSQFEGESPEAILAWAWETFGGELAATSSFQTQSVPLLHIVSKTVPKLPILFLDTGFHFPETLQFRDELIKRYKLNVVNVYPQVGHDKFIREYGELYKRDPDMCCYINKVEPLKRALGNYNAWITGIRRDQTKNRRDIKIVSYQPDTDLYKICPLATWTDRRIWQYHNKYKLPEHPLFSRGYLSVGCAPCTRPAFDDDGNRSGRWEKFEKIECGLHTDAFSKERG